MVIFFGYNAIPNNTKSRAAHNLKEMALAEAAGDKKALGSTYGRMQSHELFRVLDQHGFIKGIVNRKKDRQNACKRCIMQEQSSF